jgi:mono/diheme cytochrome c family protein
MLRCESKAKPGSGKAAKGRELKRASLLLLAFALCLAFTGCRQDMQDQPRYEVYESSGSFKDGLSSRTPVEGTVPRGYLRADTQLYTGKMNKGGATAGANRNANTAIQGGDETTGAGAMGSNTSAQTGRAGAPDSQGGGTNNATGETGRAGQTGGANQQAAQAGADDDAETFPFPVTTEVVERGRERYEIFCAMCHGYTGDGDGMIVRRGYRKPPSYHEDRLRQARAGYFFRVMTEGFGAMPPYRAQVPVQDRWAIAAYIRALQMSRMNQQLAPAHGAETGVETGGHR